MLTYDLTKTDGPLYKCLYECIKNDISQGKLSSGEKMPSKRTLAKNLGVSTITVENAYDQLIGEGYMFARPKKGYFIADVSDIRVIKAPVQKELSIKLPPEQDESIFDFSSNRTDPGNFPFSIWAKLMRETISLREQELLSVSPCGGVRELREAIASHLSSFRGMNVDPDQIIVGAGTEYLYGLLVKLLGTDKVYCVEDPGYKKISQIYECNNAKCLPVQMDEQGISVELIKKANAQIAHISPTHHFPTGITMQLGAEGVFVGSGIFKSGDPAKRAAAIVKAVTNFTDAKLIAELSEDLGEAMVGINESEIKIIMEERGK
jgi:GntR family transcriptional regulator / MocR family aminotransferase